jgi:hypothetical protein
VIVSAGERDWLHENAPGARCAEGFSASPKAIRT